MTFGSLPKPFTSKSATMDIIRILPAFFYRQLFVTPPVPSSDCSGKTIIVTGANVGLGKEAARHFVQLGRYSEMQRL